MDNQQPSSFKMEKVQRLILNLKTPEWMSQSYNENKIQQRIKKFDYWNVIRRRNNF